MRFVPVFADESSERVCSIYEEDTKLIIQNVLTNDTIDVNEKADEVVSRLVEYNGLIQRRIQELNDDLIGISVDNEEVDVSEFKVFLQQET